MIGRYINLGRLTNQIQYSFGFFQKAPSVKEEFKVPLFKKKIEEKVQINQAQTTESSRKALQDIISKINDANKYFLGVKLNTNYLKVNKVVKYSDISDQKFPSATYKDFPLNFSKEPENLETFNKFEEAPILAKKSAQVAFTYCSKERVISEMQKLIRDFIINLAKNNRIPHLEPNFELQTIKTLNALKESLKMVLHNEDQLPQIKFKNITLNRGLAVNRNDNYSTDSYGKDQTEASEGIVAYNLYRQKRENYPQIQWFSTKKINAKFQLLVKGGPYLEIKEDSKLLGSTDKTVHKVVIEANLVVPPIISEHQLTPEQFLRSYRLRPSDLVLTNFDSKNQFYPMTFTEAEKKDKLINKIE